jgi:D-amino-acid dehydrogenase
MKIVVIGAGAIGATSAYWLAAAGHEVTVLEAAPGPARGTSAANGGQLAYAYVEPMAGPEIWASLPAILAGRDGAVRMRAGLDPAFWPWGIRFLLNCRKSRFEAALSDLLELSLESRRALDWLLSKERLDFAYRVAGKLILYGEAGALERAAVAGELKRSRGLAIEVLDEAACRRLEPALSQYKEPIAGGIHAPGDAIGDCASFASGLIDAGALRHGIELKTATRVTRLLDGRGRTRGLATSTGEIEADAVVLSAGIASVELARSLSLRLPLYPVKGYSLTAPAGALAPEVSLTDRGARLLIARLGDRVRAAGLADLDGRLERTDSGRIEELRGQARRLFPEAANWDEAEPGWMGGRPMTPDGRPLIGMSAVPGLFLNTGHGGLGWTLACGSAARLARVIGPA